MEHECQVTLIKREEGEEHEYCLKKQTGELWLCGAC